MATAAVIVEAAKFYLARHTPIQPKAVAAGMVEDLISVEVNRARHRLATCKTFAITVGAVCR